MRYVLVLLFLTCSHVHALKIAVVSLAAGERYAQAVHPGFMNKRSYCLEHGYDFLYFKESLDTLRHPAWSKIKYVERVLSDYDWVFWTDADSLIMNPSIRLEDLIDDRYFLIICKQFDGIINSGQFLIKNTPLSFAFLQKVYKPALINQGQHEQGAVNMILKQPPFLSHTLVLHQRAMNSILGEIWGEGSHRAHYSPGDFILHFWASTVDQLVTHMETWSRFALFHRAEICAVSPEHLHTTESLY